MVKTKRPLSSTMESFALYVFDDSLWFLPSGSE